MKKSLLEFDDDTFDAEQAFVTDCMLELENIGIYTETEKLSFSVDIDFELDRYDPVFTGVY